MPRRMPICARCGSTNSSLPKGRPGQARPGSRSAMRSRFSRADGSTSSSVAPGRRGGRAARLSPRRHARKGRSLSAADLRRAL
jgi:hypothetical protein